MAACAGYMWLVIVGGLAVLLILLAVILLAIYTVRKNKDEHAVPREADDEP